MQVLYFNTGFGLGTAMSGGAARHFEILKRLFQKSKSIVVTTIGSYFYYKNILADVYLVRCAIFRTKELNSFHRIIAYLISTWNSLWLIRSLPKADIVYSTSDYFCDVVPAFFYRLKHKHCSWAAMIHHLCQSPFKRKGIFFVNLISFIFQRFSFFLIRKSAKKILLYDTDEGRNIAQSFIQKGFSPENIHYVWNGIDFKVIENIQANDKKYEACFAGGLRGSKGIYDLIPIWKNICLKKPNAKLYVAGEGLKKVTDDFNQKIRRANLEKNIILGGALRHEKLMTTVKESRLFISTSHEEGWGISVCEALACGVPVVAYNLPVFQFLKKVIHTTPVSYYDDYADLILTLLDNKETYQQYAHAGKSFIRSYDWNTIAKMEYEVLKV